MSASPFLKVSARRTNVIVAFNRSLNVVMNAACLINNIKQTDFAIFFSWTSTYLPSFDHP